MLCARPRWMYASCQWQRLSKAAAEGGLSELRKLETAENGHRRRLLGLLGCRRRCLLGLLGRRRLLGLLGGGRRRLLSSTCVGADHCDA